eukprot:GILI01032307.1.p1 GENE.GILI01032307.1~~GILI01032307.1.p1  ORF type:complete len:202 (+),score=27.04 GILI01032307.1:51-656(+)
MSAVNAPVAGPAVTPGPPLQPHSLVWFEAHIKTLQDQDPNTLADSAMDALVEIRKSVSQTPNVTTIISNLLAADPLPILRTYLYSTLDRYAFESCWILTNIASSESSHCMQLVHAGIYKDLCVQMGHSSNDVVEQCSWAIGNIAGESSKCRDLLLAQGMAVTLCQSFQRTDVTNTFKSNTAWAISNLCRAKPQPALQYTNI